MGSNDFRFMTIKEAINVLLALENENSDIKIMIWSIDFDNDLESKKVTVPEEGRKLIKKAKTIIINNDEFLPHMEIYSIVQNDLKNIIKKGVMHDIILTAMT